MKLYEPEIAFKWVRTIRGVSEATMKLYEEEIAFKRV